MGRVSPNSRQWPLATILSGAGTKWLHLPAEEGFYFEFFEGKSGTKRAHTHTHMHKTAEGAGGLRGTWPRLFVYANFK